MAYSIHAYVLEIGQSEKIIVNLAAGARPPYLN